MPLTKKLKRFNTIGVDELTAAGKVIIGYPLSGYLAGSLRPGPNVSRLEDAWAAKMGVKHAIACNSATSGLMAACYVCGPRYTHQDIAVPCFTMSATAAAPTAMWENPLFFMDCDPETYCSAPIHCPESHVGLILVTNLFGQTAELTKWREFADKHRCPLVEDAAQAPFAITEDGKFAGTVGDVGVFSLNVHKHLQAGEGGIIVTNNDDLADDLRCFVNHGELTGRKVLGLNLRMTEIAAAIATEQLKRAEEIIASRISLAEELTHMVRNNEGWITPSVKAGVHVYYHWAVRVPHRDRIINYLKEEGIPIRAGYVDPIYRLPLFEEFAGECPVAEQLHDEELMIFEICAWDPDKQQLEEMEEAFKWASNL